ncbi:MAG: ABC transporter substrate-binding protein [Rhodospirillales bacterium]
MTIKIRLCTAFAGAFLAFLTLTQAPQPAAASGPAPMIETFHATLLDVMKKGKQLGMKGRYERIAPAVEQTFALNAMMHIVVGKKTWTAASDADKKAVATAFKRVSAATYSNHFSGYSGQTFVTLGTKDGPRGTTLVETNLNDAGRGAVSIVYVTKEGKGKWRVIDVIIDKGISELALRKSEYRSTLKTGGLKALAGELNSKAKDLLAGAYDDDSGVGGYGN